MKGFRITLLALLLALCLLFSTGCIEGLEGLGDLPGIGDIGGEGGTHTPITPADPSELRNPGANPNPVDPSSLPAYNGEPYIVIRNNMPDFASNELVSKSFEYYSPMDALGRCVYTVACVGKDIMPTEERGSIGSVKPSGWQTVKYDIVDGKYLYNRCHLIGFQLTGENANKSNLITGTRYLNIEGMLDFENMIADYVKETGNHVLYRVTPIFVGNELVARGVEMEAYSVEDGGEGICFHVYAYNVQPGIIIDYATGNSALSGQPLPPSGGSDTGGKEEESDTEAVHDYVLNTNTKKFHKPGCSSADDISPANREEYTGTREALVEQGYDACGRCKP
jgi:DNA-entry nuclease